jgi:hypothetical protein
MSDSRVHLFVASGSLPMSFLRLDDWQEAFPRHWHEEWGFAASVKRNRPASRLFLGIIYGDALMAPGPAVARGPVAEPANAPPLLLVSEGETALRLRYPSRPFGNILRRFGIAPAPKRGQNATWSDFIRSHMAVLAGIDFFTAEVLTWRGLATYYVLFFIHLETRRVTLAGITRHPTE